MDTYKNYRRPYRTRPETGTVRLEYAEAAVLDDACGEPFSTDKARRFHLEALTEKELAYATGRCVPDLRAVFAALLHLTMENGTAAGHLRVYVRDYLRGLGKDPDVNRQHIEGLVRRLDRLADVAGVIDGRQTAALLNIRYDAGSNCLDLYSPYLFAVIQDLTGRYGTDDLPVKFIRRDETHLLYAPGSQPFIQRNISPLMRYILSRSVMDRRAIVLHPDDVPAAKNHLDELLRTCCVNGILAPQATSGTAYHKIDIAGLARALEKGPMPETDHQATYGNGVIYAFPETSCFDGLDPSRHALLEIEYGPGTLISLATNCTASHQEVQVLIPPECLLSVKQVPIP